MVEYFVKLAWHPGLILNAVKSSLAFRRMVYQLAHDCSWRTGTSVAFYFL